MYVFRLKYVRFVGLNCYKLNSMLTYNKLTCFLKTIQLLNESCLQIFHVAICIKALPIRWNCIYQYRKQKLTKCCCRSDSSISWLGESNNSLQSLEARMSYLWCSCTWNRFSLTTFVVKFLTRITESVVLTTRGCKNNLILTKLKEI